MNASNGTVLFISHDASRTGAPLFLLRFLQWFHKTNGATFRTLVGKSGPLVPDFAELGPLDLFEPEPTIVYRLLRRVRMNSWHRDAHLSSVRERLLKSNVRLIYSNTAANGKILDFLSFLDCPVICHVHELEDTIRLIGPDNMSLVRKYSSSYIAVSHATKRNLTENHKIPGDVIEVIHGFIPTADTVGERDARNVRLELKIPEESRLVCACGSIETRKGTDLFLQVARILSRTHADHPVHFIWVGGHPSLVAQMRRKAADLSLGGLVHFVGPSNDVGSYYMASDIFLLPSREDPFPLVMMEAALRAKPTICFSGSGGAPEFVEEDAGFVVPGFDANEMSKAVMCLLSDEDLRRIMGSNAREKVLKRHDLATAAPRIAMTIQNALALPSQGRSHKQAVQTEQASLSLQGDSD